ncbi:hypothetical protein DB30_06701 [Enhygromyxa salina]|uniref:Uncharacterized protein n=1 Tax=Enhygromyxa salina TaxID=215803 RepID=A0A0C1ZU19_9BACT|nr:hypothetical protein DB30_06701 [Enhygromyxa salina]
MSCFGWGLDPTPKISPPKNRQKFAEPQIRVQINCMDYVRSAAGTRVPKLTAGAKRGLRTGPLPSVPWRALDRRSASLEHYLPLWLLTAFGLLAGIQYLLLY